MPTQEGTYHSVALTSGFWLVFMICKVLFWLPLGQVSEMYVF